MKTLILAALLTAATAAQATTVWDEAINGDLSNNRLAPTALSMAIGHNVVLGTTGNANTGERDYFKFVVPNGSVLSAILLLPNTFVSGDASFFGLQAGPQITVTPFGGGTGPQSLYALIHYSTTDIGQNLLNPDTLVGASTVPAPAGVYSGWVQELGGDVNYGFDFVIASTVPEPTTALTLGLGLAGLACRRFVVQRR